MVYIVGLIYCAKNLVNSKVYVGQTSKSLDVRRFQHEHNAFVLRRNSYFYQALRKYGKESFVWTILIDNIDSKAELDEQELFWIRELNATNHTRGYNIYEGACGGDTFTNNPNKEDIRSRLKSFWTPEFKAWWHETMSGSKNPMYGKKREHSKETRSKMSAASAGKTYEERYGTKAATLKEKRRQEGLLRTALGSNPIKGGSVPSKFRKMVLDGKITEEECNLRIQEWKAKISKRKKS